MRVFYGFLGGIMAIVLYFVAWFRSVTHGLPQGVSVGISESLLLTPRFLIPIIMSFACGFTLAYMVTRPRT